jgi:MFS family permease
VRVFNLIWAGQAASLIGSAMTAFGVGVWVFQETGSPTAFALLILAASLPGLLVLPVAGALVDRWDRRRVMILSDAGTVCVPLTIVALYQADALALWHVYALAAVLSVFRAFQWPAFSALVVQIVPKSRLGQANGRMAAAEAAGQLLGALFGGVLYGLTGLTGLLVVDVVTFVVAVTTVLVSLRMLPAAPPRGATGDGTGRGQLLRELPEGWRFIRQRPGLFGLLIFFAGNNLIMEMAIVLVPPLVLSTAGPAELGVVNAVGWTGMVVVAGILSVTRQPRDGVRAILVVASLHAVLVLSMGLHHSIWTVGAAMAGILGGYAVTNAVTATIWQLKTPSQVQGRVFAVRRMMAWSAEPVAYGLAGPFVVLAGTPLTDEGGLFRGVTGGGPGAGIAAVFLLLGPVLLAVVAATALRPSVRHLERDLPDAVSPEPASEKASS